MELGVRAEQAGSSLDILPHSEISARYFNDKASVGVPDSAIQIVYVQGWSLEYQNIDHQVLVYTINRVVATPEAAFDER
jgi:hypothetical protein